MMISFSLFIWGCHDWLTPADLSPLPMRIRQTFFQVDACFFLMTVNPPLFRCLRVRRQIYLLIHAGIRWLALTARLLSIYPFY